ncbi:MAG: hypothetical protein L6406_03185, partial [Desulfobacterales bacterium]|nr:hypothetical protein [Desulfobacterales bacterium]
RLASGRVTALTGWVLNPLDSFSEFQVWLFRHLSQRSRLSLAPRCSFFQSVLGKNSLALMPSEHLGFYFEFKL